MQQASERMAEHVAIIGSGSIGSAFAVVYASAGRTVAVYDPEPESRASGRRYVAHSLEALRQAALLDEAVDRVLDRIDYPDTIEDAVTGAGWIHECAPERVELKREIFATVDAIAGADAIIASATSAIPASQIAGDLPGRERCLVAHPGNPPFLLRILELVPAPFTDRETLERAKAFSASVGLRAVHVRREVEGFLFNRLQGALLREAYCLVRDGVASVEDIDALVRDGLGLRWSVIGPFETADLNTRGGIGSHAEKLGPAYARMGRERGQDDPWTPDLVARVVAERRALLPLSAWEERVAWRDRMLMACLAARQEQVRGEE